MKKWMMLAAALVLLTAMTACGGNSDKENADSSEVALDSFYAGLAEEYHWTEDAAASEADELLLSNIEGEMLDSYYPGLSEIATKQLVAKAPLMSAVVNEVTRTRTRLRKFFRNALTTKWEMKPTPEEPGIRNPLSPGSKRRSSGRGPM